MKYHYPNYHNPDYIYIPYVNDLLIKKIVINMFSFTYRFYISFLNVLSLVICYKL